MSHRKLVPLCLIAVVLTWSAGDLIAGKKDKGEKQNKGNKKPPVAAVTLPLVEVTDIEIENVVVTAEGELVAEGVVTLDIVGRVVTQDISIPLDLTGTPGADGACDVLNLAVGPVDLDLLGLVVELDDCEGGPVTVDITAVAGGGLLGDLLCDIAGGLTAGLDLGAILGELTDEELAALTGALTETLNAILDELLATDVATAATHIGGADGQTCDILLLEIPDGLSLNVLGLQIDTSGICLHVFAERGDGNLLGNLLCTLTNLLDNPGKNAKGQAAQVKNINKVLDRLGL